MSALSADLPNLIPLLVSDEPSRPVVWRGTSPVTAAEFEAQVTVVAAALPPRPQLVNLCEDRHRFLIALAAALRREQTVLLPASRAPEVVGEVLAANPGSYVFDDAMVDAALAAASPSTNAHTVVPADHIAVIGYTSGSTGRSKAHTKRWRSFMSSTAHNAAAINARLAARGETGRAAIVATVPPQHMYGMEMSVLLPLLGDMSVHAGRPLFPADVARALADVPAPRVLVTTPVHLRALVESGISMPAIGVIVCATAPLDPALAARAESLFATDVLEVFGATETCVIASRLTARSVDWHLYDDVELTPEPDGTMVRAPWFDAPTLLQDVVELRPDRRFALRGRNADLLEIAGKRASLADLTRRVLDVPGVVDAVVFQPDTADDGRVRRVAALVVAPGLASRDVTERLRHAVDPAFLPRPLVVVDALPRNEVGKLPRERLLAILRGEAP